MSGAGPRGFYRAPLTKALAVCVVGGSLMTVSLGAQKSVRLDLPSLSHGQLWRIVTSNLFCGTVAEALVSGFLLHTFRQFERQMGSRQLAGVLTVSSLIACTFNLTAMWLYRTGLAHVASGPYAAIFALFTLYYAQVPKLVPSYVRVLGATFSDKSLFYMLGMQLAFNDGWRSFVPAVAGVATGILFFHSPLNEVLRQFRYPRVVQSFCHRALEPIFASEAPGAALARRRRAQAQQDALYQARLAHALGGALPPGAAGGGGGGGGGVAGHEQLIGGWGPLFGGGGGGGPAVGAPGGHASGGEDDAPGRGAGARGAAGGGVAGDLPPPPPPSDDAVARIMGMGFERDAVMDALRATYNNEQAAVNRLLQ